MCWICVQHLWRPPEGAPTSPFKMGWASAGLVTLSKGIHDLQAEVEPVKKIILIFVKPLKHTGILSHQTVCPGVEHDGSSKVT